MEEYRYLLFIYGSYGEPLVGSYINFCIEQFQEIEPEFAASISIPVDHTKETFWGFIYDNRRAFLSGIINSIIDKYVDTVLCFDNELCNLYIYKGVGNCNTIIAKQLHDMQYFYWLHFDSSFGYLDIFDKR